MRLRAAYVVFAIFTLIRCAWGQDQCSKLIEKNWRGIDCLHCLHPRAPGASEPIVDLLKSSCLKNVMISYVVDGSFGWKEGEIERAVQELHDAGRNVWLHLYVYNGPAQRRWQYKVFDSFAVMDPLLFRRSIVKNARTKAAFSAIVRERILPVARYAASIGARVTIAPGLEDTLDRLGVRSAVKLIRDVVKDSVDYGIVRSTCFRCQAGGSYFIPHGGMLEEHDDALFQRRWNGIVNTDGRYFRFSWEKSPFPTLDELVLPWLTQPSQRGNAFLLWIPHFQDAPPGLIPTPLNERNFRGPTEQEKKEIIGFLKEP